MGLDTSHGWDCDCYACRLKDAPKVFVVVEWDVFRADYSELHVAYLDEPTARRHAAQDPGLRVVEVPIGPHMLTPENDRDGTDRRTT